MGAANHSMTRWAFVHSVCLVRVCHITNPSAVSEACLTPGNSHSNLWWPYTERHLSGTTFPHNAVGHDVVFKAKCPGGDARAPDCPVFKDLFGNGKHISFWLWLPLRLCVSLYLFSALLCKYHPSTHCPKCHTPWNKLQICIFFYLTQMKY